MPETIPEISSKYFCIARLRAKALASIVCSYLAKPGEYLPMFGFPETTAEKSETQYDAYDQNYLSTTRAEEFSIRTFNALQRVGGCEYLVLIGLSEEQKTYLNFLDQYNVIEISDAIDAEHQLTDLSGKSEYLSCPETQMCVGLYCAILENKILRIDDQAGLPETKDFDKRGIIVAEDHDLTSSVIAVNYAVSEGLNLRMIKPPNATRFEILSLIKEWRDSGNQNYLNDLNALLFNRVENIDFDKYPFATFFTSAAPYSLILKNIIPFTFVNSDLYPDFFVFNNICTYTKPQLGSAIVFSPVEFQKEETGFVINTLERHKYSVVPLINREASPTSLGYHITEYPYDILHICSHGGEIHGLNIVEKFNDLEGNEHTIEYDEVFAFARVPGSELLEVVPLQIWRKLDGLTWKSKELKAKNYPHSLYTQMLKKTHEKKKRVGTKIDKVEGSFAIKCSYSVYQALINSIAGGTTMNPVIFNNTCWSWLGISDSFLSVGASGYIGTLWDVENKTAVSFAESFYEKVFSSTILEAFHSSLSTAKGTSSEDIYVFWGLHFSKIQPNDSKERTRLKITSLLLDSLQYWAMKVKTEKNSRTRDMVEAKLFWIRETISTRFKFEKFFLSIFNR